MSMMCRPPGFSCVSDPALMTIFGTGRIFFTPSSSMTVCNSTTRAAGLVALTSAWSLLSPLRNKT
jgi:hypothetical protein